MNKDIRKIADVANKNNNNEIKRVINGVPVTLRFSDTPNEIATSLAKDIMLKSLKKKPINLCN